MVDVRAFVGHSFSDEDTSVVQTFLRYFDQLKDVLPSFGWVHAQSAEPKELAQKVNSLITDRNVFIGICTSKERVISESDLKVPIFSSESLQGKASDFSWKTSDWVIQEIGLAVGRGMSLILLLEKGCRKPGGIQGDIEFIPFDRQQPEKAFGPLLEMIKTLSPLPVAPETATTEGPLATIEARPDVGAQDDEVPDASWDRSKYENAYFWKLITEDSAGAETIEAAYIKTADAKNEDSRAAWDSFSELWRIVLGAGGSFDKLRKIEEANNQNVLVVKNYAYALGHLGKNLESAEKYLHAAAIADDDDARRRFSRLASEKMALGGDIGRSLQNAFGTFFECMSVDDEFSTLLSIKSIAESSKDDELYIQALERMVQIRPDDFSTRFSLAFKHSEKGNVDLAFFHYNQIPVSQRSGATWNNLGVGFQNFSMPANAVRAYQESAQKGESLAMSNLGYKFMQAGFVDEAEAQFDKALEIKDFHKNVAEGVAALRDVFDKEDKLKESVFDKAKAKIEFFKRLGQALVQPSLEGLEGIWKSPDCDLRISTEDGIFRASGQYEREPNGLGSGMFGLVKKTNKYSIEYEGKILGRRIHGTMKRTLLDDDGAATALGSLFIKDSPIDFSMIVEGSAGAISVLEGATSSAPKIYSLLKS